MSKSINKKVVELPREGGPFVVIEKKYLEELKDALRAVVEGEEALRNKKTRSFKEFLEEKM